MGEISRTAQCVAIGLFLIGKGASVNFKTPKRIGAKCKEGLDELVEEGMVTLEIDNRKPVSYHYQATDKIGNVFAYKKIDEKNPDEMFPIVTDDPKLQWSIS